MAETPDVRPRPTRLKLAVLLVTALVVIAAAAYKYVRLQPHVSSLLERARVLQTLANEDPGTLTSPENLGWIREQLGATRKDLEIIRAEIDPVLLLAEHLDWVPRVGVDLAAAPALLDTAIHLCDAGWWGLLGLEPVVDAVSRTDKGSDQTVLAAALPVLAVSRPRFAEARSALVQARVALGRLDSRELSPRLSKWIVRLDRYLPVLEAATQLAQVAPKMLGHERPVTYLMMMQNNHELRATGGFISGVGMIQLSGGKVITTVFQDSYQVDAGYDLSAYPPAPAPLRKYMWASVLMFRDVNWSPDFPSSAAVASSIYRMSRGTDVDGVMGIDLDGVAALLQALGPLQPEGYPSPVTSETLLQFVGDYWTAPLRSASIAEKETSDWWTHRKDFMADLLEAALQKVTTSLESIELDKLALATLDCLQARHLLLCMHDPTVADAIAPTGWDGALQPSDGDYLMIVDSNVGFCKVNPNIRQNVDYQVDLSGAEVPRTVLTLRYVNESSGPPECFAGTRYDDSYEEMMQGCYWNYVRVYVPRGSRLLSVVGSDSQPETSEEAGKAIFSAFLVVAPGESRELVFTYELPSAVLGDSAFPAYHLLVQKQPGSSDFPVQVSVLGVDWRLGLPPSDTALDSDGRQVRFNLTRDTQLTWVSMDSGGPATWPWSVLGIIGMSMVLAGLAIWHRASPR